jgi:hypothetical protein
MLIIDVWNGNVWRRAGRLGPGQQRIVTDTKRGDELRLVVEDQGTVVMTGSDSPLLRLRPGDEPWERVLSADWMSAPTLCRLHHRIPTDDHQKNPGWVRHRE